MNKQHSSHSDVAGRIVSLKAILIFQHFTAKLNALAQSMNLKTSKEHPQPGGTQLFFQNLMMFDCNTFAESGPI